MQADGIETPLAAANDGSWPQMGMFDMLNLRINGYDFHVSLMGGQESWTDDRVKQVFTTWEELLPYYQPDANGRTWQDAATDWRNGESGLFLLGTFIASQLRPGHAAGHHRRHRLLRLPGGQRRTRPGRRRGTDRRLHDGGRAGRTRRAPRRCSPASAASRRSTPTSPSTQSVVAANDGADTSGYNALQQKSVELVGAATYIAQFLDRDTDPDFAANVVGAALADFISDPSQIDSILSTVEEQKQTYTFE